MSETTVATPEQDDAELWSALDAVRAAIQKVEGCNESEKSILLDDLRDLQDMARKLRSGRVEIVVFGEISTGKSALINALTGEQTAQVNVRGGWTKDVWHMDWEGAGYCLPGFEQSQVVLVDTPGLNEVGGADRADMARQAAERADLILFVSDSDLNETEHNALAELASFHKPILLVVNKADLYSPSQLEDLLDVLRTQRTVGVIDPDQIVVAAADPREVQYIVESADGKQRSEWRKPKPQVDELRARILELLEADGSALIALNASMYAADRSDRIAALRVRMRNQKATQVIRTFAIAKATAVALNPIAFADVAGGVAVDAAMVATLANVYGLEISLAKARNLAWSLAKAAGWVMIGEAVTTYGGALLKGISLGAAAPLVAVPQAAAAGYGSYIVGQAARLYFEQGASWGGKGPKSVVMQVLENTDKASVLSDLKAEIKKKLATNRHADE